MSRSPLRVPVALSAYWVMRSWTTNPPRYDTHTAWAVRVRISAEEPLRAAIAFGEFPAHRLDRPRPGEPENEVELRVWGETEEEPSPEHREDPWRELGVSVPEGTTWQPLTLDGDTTVLVFPRRDTVSRHRGRWIVRHDLQDALPPAFTALRTI
jgi:hypothetical protein